MVPNTVGMVPLFKNLIDFPLLHLNLTNTYWPMWFMAAVNPVVILIFKNFLIPSHWRCWKRPKLTERAPSAFLSG